MSFEKAALRVRVLARRFPASLPPMEAGLLILMIVLAMAGSL
ncbi:hypothetical protein ACRDNQ_15285 [Palleronia sp. KMU-117]